MSRRILTAAGLTLLAGLAIAVWLLIGDGTQPSTEAPPPPKAVSTTGQTPLGPVSRSEPAPASSQNNAAALPPPGSIAGRFLDSENGEGVPGVTLTAYRWQPRHSYQNNDVTGLQRVTESMSRTDGSFEVAGLLPGYYLLVRPETPGFGPENREHRVRIGVEPGERVEGLVFELTRGVPVSGRVVDLQGRPIPDAEVHASQRSGEPRVTFADGQGRFAFYGAKVGQPVVLRAAARGYLGREVGRDVEGRGLLVGVDGLIDMELVVSPCRSLEGVLVDDSGLPIRNAYVSSEVGRWYSPQATGEDGSFVVLGLPGGRELVTLRGSLGNQRLDFLNGTESVRFARETHLEGVRVVARLKPVDEVERQSHRHQQQNAHPGPGMTAGKLVDAEGNPFNNVQVSILAPLNEVHGPAFTVSGPDGLFAIDLGLRKDANLCVYAGDIVFDVFDNIRAGSKDNVLTVRPSLPVHGVVRDASNGEAVRRFSIAITLPDREKYFGGAYPPGQSGMAETIYDKEGRFTIFTQFPKRARLHIEAPGYSPASQDIDLETMDLAGLVELQLEPGRIITGVVRSLDGNPIGGARIHALVSLSRPLPLLDPQGVTGPSGRFTIKGLEARPHTVVALQQGFVPTPVEVDLGYMVKDEVDLNMVRTGEIEGLLVRAGVPVVGESVEAKRLDPPSDFQALRIRTQCSGVTDIEGRYRLRDLPPGEYEVACDQKGTRSRMEYVRRQAVVEAGMVTDVDFL